METNKNLLQNLENSILFPLGYKLIALIAIGILATSSLVAMGIIIGSERDEPKVVVLQLVDEPNVQLAVDTFRFLAEKTYKKGFFVIHRLHTFDDVKWAIENAHGYNIVIYSHGDKEKGLQIDDTFTPWMHLVDVVLENKETTVMVQACYSGIKYDNPASNYGGNTGLMDAEVAGWLGAVSFAEWGSEGQRWLNQDEVWEIMRQKLLAMEHPLEFLVLTTSFSSITSSQTIIMESLFGVTITPSPTIQSSVTVSMEFFFIHLPITIMYE